MTLLISNDPSKPPPAGRTYFVDTGHEVVGRGRIADAGGGWLALEEVEKVAPFRAWGEGGTVLAYNPDGPSREAAERPGQRRFRERLMRLYGGECAVTGCNAEQMLDAAHLRSWRIDDPGVLLRADIHRMIDRGLAEIRGGRFRLVCPAPASVEAEYGKYDGAKLAQPRRARGLTGPARGG